MEVNLLKFIHAADLHLDSPFLGLKTAPASIWKLIYSSSERATINLIDCAISEQVDFVLLVGDLFDRETQNIQAQLFLRNQLERLDEVDIPVFISWGNHDYSSESRPEIDWPSNVTVFDSQVSSHKIQLKSGEQVAISGFSYRTRWLNEDLISNFVPDKNAEFNIAMLHGGEKTGEIRNNHYAPFTVGELTAAGFDYWALGHIHQFQKLASSVPIYYSGTIQGRNHNEDGTKGALLVNLTHTETKVDFIETDVITWQKISISVDEKSSIAEILELMADKIKENISDKLALISVEIENQVGNTEETAIQNGTLLERLQDMFSRQTSYWPYEIKEVIQPNERVFSEVDNKFWQASEAQLFTDDVITETAGTLFSNAFIANHFHDQKVQSELKQAVLRNIKQKAGHKGGQSE